METPTVVARWAWARMHGEQSEPPPAFMQVITIVLLNYAAAEREACARALSAMADEYASGAAAAADPQVQHEWGYASGVLRLAEERIRARGKES